MTVFWWIVGGLLLLSGGAATAGFAGYVWLGEDRWLDFAKKCWHWTLVIALAAFNFGIFKHIIGTLIEIWF